MYRQYEDPYKLNKYLCELEAEYQTLLENDADADVLADLSLDIYVLKDRVNFAWQDDEYYHDNYDYEDEMWMWENVYN